MSIYRSKRLHHNTPGWVSDHAIYHIRIRSKSPVNLMEDHYAEALLNSVRIYTEQQKWSCFIMLIMPDHVHALMSFSILPGMTATIRNWKHFHAVQHGVHWQKGFFDHRIRSHQEFSRTYAYILNNPVSKGLVETIDDWPWKLTSIMPDAVPHF